MLLKKISLTNIRSYEFQEVEFSEGATLLSGDIGSGKTSILLGIEFALFGLQPGQRGSALLKNGETNGGVKIEFEVEEKQVIIERTLKKAKTISQDYCAITINNEKKETSVTELKNTVLELLNYPKEFSKKQNLLYKFTVYTPQEEMKQIILQDAETRTNTLRHVFGIDKYKRILENTSIITLKLREDKRMKEGRISNLEQDKTEVVAKEDELKIKQYDLILSEEQFSTKNESRKKIEQEIQEISGKIQEKTKLQQEIEKTKLVIVTKDDSIKNNQKTIEQLILQIQELEQLKFDESKIIELDIQIATIKSQIPDLNETNLQITSQISSLNLKNQENDTTKQKISHIEICPTCLQDVDPVYKSNVVNKMDSNTSENVKKIEGLRLEKINVSGKLSKLDLEANEKQKQLQELKILKIKLQNIEEKQTRLNEIKNLNLASEKDILLLKQHNESLKNSVFELNKFDNLFQEKQRQLEESRREERMADIRVAELKKEIDVFSRQIGELKEKISKTEEIRNQLHYISELENWLTKRFIPVISFIEKNVMVKLKSEFSELFSKWFGMLVSDTFNVQLDDNFTPLIEQQDYEIDYAYLSGGERTAIALAYRLALNQVINSLLSKINTRNLVILDEPTDGFSEQQLDKMRDILSELDVKQLIIVSHEQKIEGFVENIIRIKKENGISGMEG